MANSRFSWAPGEVTITLPKKSVTTKFGWVTIDDHPVLLGDPDGHGGYGPKPPMTKGPHSKETGKTVAEIVGHNGSLSAEGAMSALAALPGRYDWVKEQLQQRYPEVEAKVEQRLKDMNSATSGQQKTAREMYMGAVQVRANVANQLSTEYNGMVHEITSSKDPASVRSAGKWSTPHSTEGVAEFNRLLDSSAIPDRARMPDIVGGTAVTDGRSYFDGSRNVVAMARGADKETTVHELGHWLESQRPDVQQATQQFLDDRTHGEKPVSMASLYPGYGYGKNEMTTPDQFYHPYVGIRYGRASSEVVSMGLERMSRDPAGFAKEDPGHFKFTWNIMRGIK